MAGAPGVVPFGDSAVLIVLGDRLDLALNRRVRLLGAAAQASLAADDGWLSPVPGHASLLLPYDPGRLDVVTALAEARALLDQAAATAAEVADEARTVEIAVRYGGDNGPDLAEVAERCGLTESQVVQLHASSSYEVLLLGFAPGFAYLGLLPAQLVLPRRLEPRPRVPPGSVAIAGEQTAVYPLATPGGWHLLGRTDAPLWDARRDPPALLRPGDRVRFVPTRHGGG